MAIYKIETGNFMLDGGAMFGIVPKSLWKKVYPANEQNLCNLSLRLLVVKEKNRVILLDTGLGDKQDEKFFSYYYLSNTVPLIDALAQQGIKTDEVTDVVLTHLHFDHCGGAVSCNNQCDGYYTTFKNAVYWCSESQWNWAMDPNPREKASFLSENILPLKKSGQLKFLKDDFQLSRTIRIRLFNGHTKGLAVPFINYNGKTLVFIADLIPTAAHIPLAWVCGYDVQPLESFKEKGAFLKEAVKNNYTLFFEHDYYVECCNLCETEKGIRIDKSSTLTDFINS